MTLISKKQIATQLIERAFSENPQWNDCLEAKPPQALAKVRLEHKQVANLPISEPVLSVLAGTITGDSSIGIDKRYQNARVQGRHSTQQYSWFAWKYMHILKKYTNRSGVVFTDPDGYQVGAESTIPGVPIGKLKIATKAHEDLTELNKIICPHGKKELSRFWLNHMTDYYLMTVWLDDGSLHCEKGRQGRISLDSFPLREQKVFMGYLETVWGVKTTHVDTGKVMKNGQAIWKIDIADLDNLMKFLRIVAPIVPVKEMLYKVCLMPQDKGLLQRWKSELLGLVHPQFVDYIKDYYDRNSPYCSNQVNLD
jgi:hypothetical protein